MILAVNNVWEAYDVWNESTSDGSSFGSGNYFYLAAGYDQIYNAQKQLTAYDTVNKKFHNKTHANIPRGDTGKGSASL